MLKEILLTQLITAYALQSSAQNQELITYNVAYNDWADPSRNETLSDTSYFILHLDDQYSRYVIGATDPVLLRDPTKSIKYSVLREVDSQMDHAHGTTWRKYLVTLVASGVPLSDQVHLTVWRALDNRVLGLLVEWEEKNSGWGYY